MLTEKEERRTKHVVRRMLERQKGRREIDTLRGPLNISRHTSFSGSFNQVY